MKARSIIGLAVLASATFLCALPAQAAVFYRSDAGQVSPYGGGGWENGYYDAAWGMPLAVLVPPNARWQTDYSWGAGGTRISRIGSRFNYESSGPESAYDRSQYLPAPPHPSDTQQQGDYYVRGRRR